MIFTYFILKILSILSIHPNVKLIRAERLTLK